jgi:hypothetical protein
LVSFFLANTVNYGFLKIDLPEAIFCKMFKKSLISWLILPCLGIYSHLNSQSIPIPNFTNPVSMGMGAQGVGWNHSISSLYTNPGFLVTRSRSILDLGVQGGKKGELESTLQLGGIGAYYSYSPNLGFWGIYNQKTSNHFPGDEKTYLNQGNLGIGFKFWENYGISMGLGPGSLQRYQSYSPWKISGFLGLSFVKEGWSAGASIQYLGTYSREDYRGSDSISEKLPEIASMGVGYQWESDWGIYSEIRRTFWENANTSSNGEKTTPNYERGIGAEWAGSYSLQKKNFLIENLDLRLGNEWGGVYLPDGKLQRSLGLAIGSSYHWEWSSQSLEESNENTNQLSFHFGIIDYALTAQNGSREKETLASFSLTYMPAKEEE